MESAGCQFQGSSSGNAFGPVGGLGATIEI